MGDKFIRFVTRDRDPVTGEYLGFFKAAYSLRRAQLLPADNADALNRLLDWFDDNLNKPMRFARSKNRHAHGKAISWFKPSAVEHIDKARRVLILLKSIGRYSEMLATDKPGVVIYEDDFQIAAIPFRDREF